MEIKEMEECIMCDGSGEGRGPDTKCHVCFGRGHVKPLEEIEWEREYPGDEF